MKKNMYEELTDKQLRKKKTLLKGASIGLSIVYFLAITILIYLWSENKLENNSIGSFIPVFILPITFLPLIINFKLINQEIKSRNL
ncbi:hypothetical protein [Flavobacterium hibisci]|uniref:hypothetical protein n=1 Tax=Flavobacterium hibisci TaxID=1914462 RepID=UPI001CC00FC1|nr:hypothetical protein [Flavobacterium hibisci]MBZ4044571.1 hypothetical protein [Flavobacterium hibisci]